MGQDRQLFQTAMRAATDAAWEGKWEEAIGAYRQALDEFPDSVEALTGLGVACSSAGQMEQALEVYQRASDLDDDDPVLLERVGTVLEELGRLEEAAEAYVASGKGYVEQQQAQDLALGCWQAAVDLHPECVDAHLEMLKHYQQRKQMGKAIDECLELAHIYRSQGRAYAAHQICRHALRIAPGDARALSMLNELQGDEPPDHEAEFEWVAEGELLRRADTPNAAELMLRHTETDDELPARSGSPAELTRRRALRDLAERIFNEQESRQEDTERVNTLLSRAMDFQTRGRSEEAIALYERVIQEDGDCPAVRFNLGVLNQARLRFAEALDHFRRAASKPDYRLGSRFAMGECHRAEGQTEEALKHFINVLRMLDLGTADSKHATALNRTYDAFASSGLTDRNQARRWVNLLVGFFDRKGWEHKVRKGRRLLDTLGEEQPVMSLAEVLTEPGWEHILESIVSSQDYARRGLLYTAMEMCYFALEPAPNYVPTHRQLAELALQMGHVEEAVRAVVVIARTYEVRGVRSLAAKMYERALKLAPMDTAVRARLIHLHVDCEAIDQALGHYLVLGESYYHLAQMRQAREIYQEALELAAEADDTRDWTVRMLHRIGDIDVQRVDWKSGVSVYERIRDMAPDDQRAGLALVELYYRLNEEQKAIKALDELLMISGKEPSERLFRGLEDLVDRWPEAVALRAGLAQAHLDAGHEERALEHLERLVDLQLGAGRTDELTDTIQAIVALDPPDADDYKMLLEQIETGESADR